MKKKNLFLVGGLLLSLLYMIGCENAAETVKKATNDIEEAIEVETTKNSEFVMNVKNGTLNSFPDQLIGDAFEDFFSSGDWKYFQADTGEQVVEFTGFCMYMEEKVKARLQFIVDEDTGNFEVGALSFNEVPQNELTIETLLLAIYEENIMEPDPSLGHNDSYYIEKAHQSYIDTLATDTIGNIFSETLFSNLIWSVDEYANIIINGDYNGEIFPGEPSNLQFTLSEVGNGEYTIIDLLYNGETVPVDNYSAVTDIIYYATAY